MAMTDGELRDAALLQLDDELAHLKKTTRGLKGFTPPAGSEWGQALKARQNAIDLVKQVGVTPPAPSPSPPPTGAVGVNPATMLITGGKILRDDSSAQADPAPGLWGSLDAVSASRHQLVTSGGSPHPRADGTPQGNSNYRALTVQDGDDFYGERCELGRNERQHGENTGTATAGTFALYNEGDHKITFWSMRLPSGKFSTNVNDWQCIMQMKQAQPYAANGPVNSAPAITLDISNGAFRLSTHWARKWSTPVPAFDVWFRIAFEAYYSKDPAKAKIRIYIDKTGDGVCDTDSGWLSVVDQNNNPAGTLAYCTTAGNGLAVGDPIPGHLRLGIYHSAVYPTSTAHYDNVQIVG